LKFEAIAEKTAKHLKGYFLPHTAHIPTMYQFSGDQ